MNRRINIVLPDKTLAILDRVASKGSRSRFISRAVVHFVESQGKQSLRQRLKQEALANAERDVAMAAEWFNVEEELFNPKTSAKAGRKSRNTKRS